MQGHKCSQSSADSFKTHKAIPAGGGDPVAKHPASFCICESCTSNRAKPPEIARAAC